MPESIPESPIVVKLATSLAAEVFHLECLKAEANSISNIRPSQRTQKERYNLDDLIFQIDCLSDTTTVLKECYLALYPQITRDLVNPYKWALAALDGPELDEEEDHLLTDLRLYAKEYLGDYRTEMEKLPPLELPPMDLPIEDSDPNLR
ncbi:MAG: hypothetical protein WC763_07515, partial [Candidatus Paceibacterota bacterium]